jgi:hypothetical protein
MESFFSFVVAIRVFWAAAQLDFNRTKFSAVVCRFDTGQLEPVYLRATFSVTITTASSN